MNELMDADLDLKEALGYLRAARMRIDSLYQGSGMQWAAAGQALFAIDELIHGAENALAPLAADLTAAYATYNAGDDV
jgi:hypothetical protein